MSFPTLKYPIVQAPLAGGPSTPELAAAVSDAGGLGFLAAGYLTPERVSQDITRFRELSTGEFGVNVFCLRDAPVDLEDVARYARRLEPLARAQGVELGTPRFEDDAFDAKVRLLLAQRPSVASFTFGCPSPDVIERLQDAGIDVWVTVTDVQEARIAAAAGADALVAQGVEAGGHRGSFNDTDGAGELGLLALLRLISAETELPLIAAGGIADGHGIAAARACGAVAAQIGTAFMLCPEAGTSQPHREALSRPGTTALTRAFTGRRARGIVNGFMAEHGAHAPAAYPHVHHLTSPLRAAARKAGDANLVNLWAGETYPLAQAVPAAELVKRWSGETADALAHANA